MKAALQDICTNLRSEDPRICLLVIIGVSALQALPPLPAVRVPKTRDRSGSGLGFRSALLVGNWDRRRNLKVALATPHVRLFVAFDHSHALFGIDEDPVRSVDRLGSGELVMRYHPFFGKVSRLLLDNWVSRIAALHVRYVREC